MPTGFGATDNMEYKLTGRSIYYRSDDRLHSPGISHYYNRIGFSITHVYPAALLPYRVDMAGIGCRATELECCQGDIGGIRLCSGSSESMKRLWPSAACEFDARLDTTRHYDRIVQYWPQVSRGFYTEVIAYVRQARIEFEQCDTESFTGQCEGAAGSEMRPVDPPPLCNEPDMRPSGTGCIRLRFHAMGQKKMGYVAKILWSAFSRHVSHNQQRVFLSELVKH